MLVDVVSVLAHGLVFAHCQKTSAHTHAHVHKNTHANVRTFNHAHPYVHHPPIIPQHTLYTPAGPRFVDVLSVSDFWKWAKGPMVHAAYMSDWYKGDPWSVGDQGLIAGHNIIVGTVNMRQKRVRRATCVVPQQFQGANSLDDCIADYHPGGLQEMFRLFFSSYF